MGQRGERFERYLKIKGLSRHFAEKESGVSNGLLAKSLQENSDLGLGAIEKLLSVFGDLSRDWLITGEGPMLREERGSVTGNTVSGNGNTLAGRVVYPEGRDGGMSLGEEVIRLRAQNDLLREQNEKLISALTARGDRA